jgi:acyl-CoA reductase-like NAD-dependent aldehyde dehydrogenase
MSTAPLKNAASALPHEISARIGGAWRAAEKIEDDIDPYRGDVVARAPISTSRDCEDAIAAACKGKVAMAAMPGYERAALLRRAADILASRADEIGPLSARESGKAIRETRAEVPRTADILRMYAEEAVRIQGEHVNMDGSVMGAGKIAMVMRYPVGVVAGISPFNAPLSAAAHKLGPALAAGNSIILKPSPKAPLCVHKFVEAIIDAGVPDGAVNSLYGDEIGPQLVSDPRVDFVSFTGSIPVGKRIRATAGMKRVALELGGVGPTFVDDDSRLAEAAKTCARNAMLVAGQSCASVQNVFVRKRFYDEFLEIMLREVDTIRFGDPLDPATEVGTMIDEQAALRVESIVDRAADAGATLLRRGARRGALMEANVVADVDSGMEVFREELFGPGMTVQPYEEIDPLFDAISQSRFGLQCGVYTASMDLALKAIKTIRTGGVIINGTSRWRHDFMPYGGVKDSGIGREGPKASMLDMTEERFFVFN